MSASNARIALDAAVVAHLERFDAILRANRMHEGTCAFFLDRERVRRSPDPGMPVWDKCDCWLADPLPQVPA